MMRLNRLEWLATWEKYSPGQKMMSYKNSAMGGMYRWFLRHKMIEDLGRGYFRVTLQGRVQLQVELERYRRHYPGWFAEDGRLARPTALLRY